MEKPKLVKDRKVKKFPRSSNRVINILEDAVQRAKTNKWKAVIVVALGYTDDVDCGWSRTSSVERLGMLQVAQGAIYERMDNK